MKFHQLFILFCILVLTDFCYSQKSIVLKSNKKSIHYYINAKKSDWSISPEIKPDRLKIYCNKKQVLVKFLSDIDSIQFEISDKDTLRFTILLQDSIKALTEVVGVYDLPNCISLKEKLYNLSQFWSEAKYNFVNMDSLKINWDSLFYSYINKVTETKNDYEYYRLMKRFAATLQDGHTQIFDNGQFNEFSDYIKISLMDFDKKIYIVRINKESGLDSTFLGAQLVEVNGMPINQYLKDSLFPFISSSTEQSLWMHAVINLQSGFKNKKFIGKTIKTNGKIGLINLPFNGEATRKEEDSYWGLIPDFVDSYVNFKWLKDSIAYINIVSFYPQEEVIKEFESHINNIKKAKALILDIRENGGGSTEVAWRIQSHLTNGNYFLNFGYQTRINNGVHKANGNWIDEYKEFYLNRATEYFKPDTVFVDDSIYRIKIPTVILIGRYTFSAAEDLLINLYEVPYRPIFIGEPTGGSTGSPLVIFDMSGNGLGRICTRRECFPYSKKPFINHGIKPDILVCETINKYLNKKDVIIDTAIQILKKRINSKSNKYLILTYEKIKQLGIEVIDNGIFYKNKNPISSKINGFYCVKGNYCTIVSLSENNSQSKINNKFFNKKDITNNDFYPVLISNINEDKTFEQQSFSGRLLPILVNMTKCKSTKRTDQIVIWFKVTDSLLKRLSDIDKVEEYIQSKIIN